MILINIISSHPAATCGPPVSVPRTWLYYPMIIPINGHIFFIGSNLIQLQLVTEALLLLLQLLQVKSPSPGPTYEPMERYSPLLQPIATASLPLTR